MFGKFDTLYSLTMLQLWPYFTMHSFYALSYCCIKYFNNTYLFPFIVYALIPLVDHMIPMDHVNPSKEQLREMQNNKWFKVPLYLLFLVDWIYSIWSVNYICAHDFNWFHTVGFVLGTGVFATSNINLAHELMHKSTNLDKSISQITLFRNFYTHFTVEHTKGHHKNVATPKDPASAKFNQTLYQFLPQTLIGTLKSAYQIEAKQRNSIFQNRIIQNWTLQFIFSWLLIKYWGTKQFIYFFLTGVNGVIFLEAINYLERKEISPGVYEKTSIKHSWNAPYFFSNCSTFKLQRHSDHHENSFKEYQTLCSYDESPTLPQSYPICMMMAFFPQKWFSVMNPIVISHNENQPLNSSQKMLVKTKMNQFLYQNICFYTLLWSVGFLI